MNKKQKLGQYFTTTNIFNDEPLKIWSNEIPNWKTQSLLEPFAGACDILNYFPNREWTCFDIESIKKNVKYRDTIKDFPKGFDVCITNPPYLAKNRISRLKQKIELKYEDLYLDALEQCLDNCKYVSVIIPSTFIGCSKMKERCLIIDKIDKVVFSDTTNPVCVAYFVPYKVQKTLTFVNGKQVFLNFNNTPTNTSLDIKFNVYDGNYVLTAVDKKIKKISINNDLENFDRKKYLKHTSRYCVLFKTNSTINLKSINNFIEKWRDETQDYFLTSFKSPISSNEFYRKRMSFNQLKWIIEKSGCSNKSLLKWFISFITCYFNGII